MSEYKLHLTKEQIDKLEQGEEDVGVMEIEAPDGRIITTEDLDLVDIIMGKGKKVA